MVVVTPDSISGRSRSTQYEAGPAIPNMSMTSSLMTFDWADPAVKCDVMSYASCRAFSTVRWPSVAGPTTEPFITAKRAYDPIAPQSRPVHPSASA
jgi:hypothetical protein